MPAIDGFAAESFVLVVPAVIVVAATAGLSDSIPRQRAMPRISSSSSLAGVSTAVPLILFAFAAARVPLTVLGPLQYLIPTINFLLGWALYDEELPWARLVGFGLVWAALLIVTVDERAQHRHSPGRLPHPRRFGGLASTITCLPPTRG